MNAHGVEHVRPGQLKPHPRNYKVHPDEQLEHLAQSISEHGFYRNVVVARDYTILAGHGIMQAIEKMGLYGPDTVPIIRLDLEPDDPRALKIMTSDNELGKLAETDDRRLTELLRDGIGVANLLGTGFDGASLAALVMVTRPVEEVRDKNEAAEWLGMPEFELGDKDVILNVRFTCAEDRERFVKESGVGVTIRKTNGRIWSGWWPPIERQNLVRDLLFTDEES